jgi:MFS family permease
MKVAQRPQRESGASWPTLIQLSSGQVALQAGSFAFIASLPLALSRSNVSDAEIGLIVALSALVQVPAALIGGALVDRFGPVRMLAAGGAIYMLSAVVLLLPAADDAASLLPFAAARVAQGVGFGMTRPAWLALLPRIIANRHSGIGLGIALAVQNISLIVMPPLSLAILGDSSSLDAVALVTGGFVLAGIASLFVPGGLANAHPRQDSIGSAIRRYGFAYHRSWTPVLVIMLLYLVHWGAISAYLPQYAERAEANVGLFFAADGLLALLVRVPSGWLADRFQARWLVLLGLGSTAAAMGLLLLPVTTGTLTLAGVLTGAGASLLTTPVYVELSALSAPSDRGTAFAMVMVTAGIGNLLGSAGLAPIIDTGGFGVVVVVSMASFVVAAVVTIMDRRLASIAHPPPEALEPAAM